MNEYVGLVFVLIGSNCHGLLLVHHLEDLVGYLLPLIYHPYIYMDAPSSEIKGRSDLSSALILSLCTSLFFMMLTNISRLS